jgi:hypothetical protein
MGSQPSPFECKISSSQTIKKKHHAFASQKTMLYILYIKWRIKVQAFEGVDKFRTYETD